MIRTKNAGYWTTGITLRYRDFQGNHPECWGGSLDFYDDGSKDDAATGQVSTEGVLHTRNFVEHENGETVLTAVIDTLIADATSFGIQFKNPHGKPTLSVEVEDEGMELPDGWRQMLRAQANRIGWDCDDVDVETS
jgi:hypothetical protein